MNIPLRRATWAEINLNRLKNNLYSLKSCTNASHCIAVVKADAYGHGSIEVARQAQQCGVDMLAVASLDEAVHLRTNSIEMPILVLGPVSYNDLEVVADQEISITVYDINCSLNLIRYKGKPINVHIKIETGMQRYGLTNQNEISKTFDLIEKNESVNLQGLYSHLAYATDKITLGRQVDAFKNLVEGLDHSGIKYVHLSNSAGLEENLSLGNTVRLGISMYGLLTPPHVPSAFELKQVISLHSKVLQVKAVKAGTPIGYDHSYTTQSDAYIATVPIGYADGFLRKNQNGFVEINQRRYKVVGRICMDSCMVLVDESVMKGDIVNILNDSLTVLDMAQKLDTITYEITCNISLRVPRVYHLDGKKFLSKNTPISFFSAGNHI